MRTRDIVIDALRMAWFKRHPSKQAGLIFRSARGSQHASQDFRDMLTGYGCTASVSRRGNCWGNVCSKGAVRVVEGGAAAKPTLCEAAPSKVRSYRWACGCHASRFVTRLWGTDSRGKVKSAVDVAPAAAPGAVEWAPLAPLHGSRRGVEGVRRCQTHQRPGLFQRC